MCDKEEMRMTKKRPDLSDVDPEVRAYIEALEAEVAQLQQDTIVPSTASVDAHRAGMESGAEVLIEEPSEPPTTINVITISQQNIAKRTPRHLYTRQHRGGMGVFDLDVPEDDPPTILVTADQGGTGLSSLDEVPSDRPSDVLIIFTDRGRTFRLRVHELPEAEVRAKGIPLTQKLPLRGGERIVAALPEGGGDHIAVVGERGWIRLVRASFVGKAMIPGVVYYDVEQHGPLAAACWVAEGDDVFIATEQGSAIRFMVRRVPASGCLGVRLDRDDKVVAVAAVREDSGVFLLSHDGKGTIRPMSGFRANKNPGGGGKIALKTDKLVDAIAVPETEAADKVHPADKVQLYDIFIISRNSKIIRFEAAEVPAKTGTVQGVNCIALRADEATACTISKIV
jgi:DNA gyrase subunit A